MWHRTKCLLNLIGIAACLMAFAGCDGAAEPSPIKPALTTEPTEPPPTEAPTDAPPTAEATAEPTFESPHASANVVYQTGDNTLMSSVTGTGEGWVFTGMNFPLAFSPPNPISSFDTNVYALAAPEQGDPLQVFEVTPVMTRALTINVPGEPRSLAVTVEPGTPNIWLAVGTIDRAADPYTARLALQTVDAPDAQVIAEANSDVRTWFAPVRWSDDAQRLYYSLEPEGLGGYILFDGWSSLFVYDVAQAAATPLIPFDPARAICVDDLSPDEQWAAHHCEIGAGIGLIDVATGEDAGVIAPPAEIAGEASIMGSARFSPDGARLAFALARNNPDAEQGWVAVADDLTGTSRLVLTAEPNRYYHVEGWANDQTLVVQEYGIGGDVTDTPRLWLVPVDGGAPQLIGDGRFVTLIPAMVP